MSAFAVMTGMAANLSSSGAPFRGFLPLVDKDRNDNTFSTFSGFLAMMPRWSKPRRDAQIAPQHEQMEIPLGHLVIFAQGGTLSAAKLGWMPTRRKA
jgi:hypothetical protein